VLCVNNKNILDNQNIIYRKKGFVDTVPMKLAGTYSKGPGTGANIENVIKIEIYGLEELSALDIIRNWHFAKARLDKNSFMVQGVYNGHHADRYYQAAIFDKSIEFNNIKIFDEFLKIVWTYASQA
jgi:hypothetical protein